MKKQSSIFYEAVLPTAFVLNLAAGFMEAVDGNAKMALFGFLMAFNMAVLLFEGKKF